jgi:Flp pilus assembly protein TadG
VPIRRKVDRAAALGRGERGSVLVEFALMLPILTLLLVGIIQVGLYLVTSIDLQGGTREAGRLLVTSSSDPTGVQDVEAMLAENVGSEVDPSKLKYSFNPVPAPSAPLWPSGSTVTMTMTYPYQLNVLGAALGGANMITSAQVRVQ